ncbi:nicotinamide-nucleotide amidohydrolase family protein [Hyphomicrobium sp.]|uniref:CinA family protein n=1 Tax=Hyphomicrobium sp. TaxID=82 RepID=UPI002BDF9C73|nr:nicotinamide-nucleotide amidohydrolase family protein [Hyphomicrobium sp.]HRN89201.1 nicotinamide-nucleotide amidohydrolase family protein [Hyphomicrobium sp.]HRQ26123.1 nicotinamide-nucleotide amidohydrolase family protein [Hyphomicrobium sp.]
MVLPDLVPEAQRLLSNLRERGFKLATAESCTGGLLAALFTEVAGASDVFERGFVTYTNAAKIGQLGVDLDILLRHGAVSAETAAAMANGALRCSAADVTLSVTGIAGPTGGTPDKPVGLVYLGHAFRGRPTQTRELRLGEDRTRSDVREKTVAEALALLRQSFGG